MKPRTHFLRLALAALVLAACLPAAFARNVDLTTVPPREEVQLTIYNSEDLTLVREYRSLTLKQGSNRIQYAWANTLIDPTSVELRPLEHEEDIEILDTTFLHDKPQACIWNIDSQLEGQVRFQVTYFTSGISWTADYVATSDQAEETMAFDGYVRITNRSGEEFENAQIRLVVGVVNLVEKIQELARRGIKVPPPGQPIPTELRRRVMTRAVAQAEAAKDDAGATAPPEIVKEGLSEYFIYTVDGHWTVPNGWSKRLVSFRARDVAFDILYRLRPHQYGPRPIRFFLFKNDIEHKLGTTPLPDGIVRTFRNNGRDGLSYLGETTINYVPIKEDIELNVGSDDEVVHKRTNKGVHRFNFTFDGGHVVGWDETRSVQEEIRNFKAKAITMEVRHAISGDVDLAAENATLHDYHTVQFTYTVPPRETLAWHYKTTHHLSRNARQNRIKLN
jgi:hypothetical protein